VCKPIRFNRRALLSASLLWVFANAPTASVLADERVFSIVVDNFYVKGSLHESGEGRDLARTIRTVLSSSGRFVVLDRLRIYSETPLDFDTAPQLHNWRVTGVDYLLRGLLAPLPDGRIMIKIFLWDIANDKRVTNMQYLLLPSELNRMPYVIANVVYEGVTGQPGKFK
jgi:Tol biopolymer transport system component